MITNILLSILVLLYVIIYHQNILRTFKSPRTKFIEFKLEQTDTQIMEKEIQKFSALEMRESIRLDRDKSSEACDALEAEAKRDHKEGTTETLTAKLKDMREDVVRYERQMQMLDDEVNGLPYQSPENPGKQGINDIIASLNEARKMFVSYLESNQGVQ
jgi:hypothetical protein